MDDSEYGSRSAKGEWTPNRRANFGPLFTRPFRPTAIARWIVSVPGYLFPWNTFYAAVAIAAYKFATPNTATMRHFSPGWITWLLVRNLAVTIAWFGIFHLRLYTRRTQEIMFKYNARWPRNSGRFMFGGQTRENVFLTLASGVPIWTGYEAITMWLFANGHITWLKWSRNPVWFIALFVLIPLWRELHFYAVHRLIHAPRLYKAVHSLHHRNTNPGPWSGLSMHPVEHVVYFSAVLIHWVVPSHPVHAMYNLFHLAMAPVPGHSGFEKVKIGDARAFDTGCLNHYLHHKYFEVNYSDGAIPLDRWFGSFHDGSADAHEQMKQRLVGRTASEMGED